MPGQERRKWLPWLATTSICFVIGLGAVALLVGFQYGTWAAATHAWRGDVILCDRYEVAIDRPRSDPMIAFRLTNRSKQPVRVVGVETSCTCLITTGLPFNCPPGASKALEVRFKPKNLDEPVRETIRVFTDRPGQGIIPLTISTNRHPEPKG